MRERVAWVGVGSMGRPMVRRLTDAGLSPLIFDLDRRALEDVAPEAVAVGSLEEVAAADVIVSTLPDDTALLDVARVVLSAISPNAVFCDMSTVSSEASAEVGALAAGKAYLRAPISGTVAHAEEGSLTILASGPEPAYRRCLPLFHLFAGACFYLGPAEEARILKLVINNMVGSLAALVGESLALAGRAGLDRAAILEVLGASTVSSPILRAKLELLRSGDFPPDFTTEMMIKDMQLFADAAAHHGSPAPLASVTLSLLRRHAESGGAKEDYYSLLKLFEREGEAG